MGSPQGMLVNAEPPGVDGGVSLKLPGMSAQRKSLMTPSLHLELMKGTHKGSTPLVAGKSTWMSSVPHGRHEEVIQGKAGWHWGTVVRPVLDKGKCRMLPQAGRSLF